MSLQARLQGHTIERITQWFEPINATHRHNTLFVLHT